MQKINRRIGQALKSIRSARGMTLEDAAQITGVSKPMLGQIERGQSTPTVTTLWKIAVGFKVPFSVFLEERQAEYEIASPNEQTVILGDNGKMRAYPLFVFDPVRRVETFYMEFDAGCHHHSDKHEDGVEEHIFVLEGSLQLIVGEKVMTVQPKQAVRFRADMPHDYQNISCTVCTVYHTIFYPGYERGMVQNV